MSSKPYRYMPRVSSWFIFCSAWVCLVAPLGAATPTAEEMWAVIVEQQKVIEQLQARLAATDAQVEENTAAVETTADAIETTMVDDGRTSRLGHTTIGGYGELHYNNLEDDDSTSGGDDGSLERTDYHRFVLFFGHSFTDGIRFFSELELEHSVTGEDAPGEVELEQAWLEMDLNDRHRVRAGLDILPIGIINPTHEPNTFYGVERNRVESEIIPATWWEAGAGHNGELAPGWNYDVVLHTGLAVPTSGSSVLRPRSGRLKVSEADDAGAAVTGRIRYTGIPGLELALSGQYQADVTGTADVFDISATLFEAHVDYRHNSGPGLRALYARWDFDGAAGLDPAGIGADTLDGWYIEPSWRFSLGEYPWGEAGVFARYSRWDDRNGISAAFRYEEYEQFAFGFNWWPHYNVVVKFDYQWEDTDAPVATLRDGFNLGLGYQF